jgi:predicted DNA-binding protein YlxM (UPF0122 family)
METLEDIRRRAEYYKKIPYKKLTVKQKLRIWNYVTKGYTLKDIQHLMNVSWDTIDKVVKDKFNKF